ncbi:MAG: THxN family PEP-CTERM protein [Pseudomonadota bacterium]
MKFRMIQKALAVGIIAITSSYAMQASAAPIFSFTEYGGFADMVAVADYSDPLAGDASLVPATTPLYSTMSWIADRAVQSSLELSTVTGPSPLAADTWTTISTLTHNNVLIRNATSWGPQDIWGRFKVSDADGGSSVVLDDTSAVTIALTETPNIAPCNIPNPVGTTCDDYFAITGVGLGDLLFTANDGSQWMASFRFANLVNAIQVGNTVYTGEARTSTLDVQVMLTSVTSVPEPATLGILGLGLLGIGFASRRKQNGALPS